MNVRPERFVHVVDIRKQARNASLERHCLGFYLGNIGNTRNRALSKMAVSGSTPRNQNGTSRSTPDRNTSELRRIVQTFPGAARSPPLNARGNPTPISDSRASYRKMGRSDRRRSLRSSTK